MKLGTETGSVINHLQSRATRGQPVPEVGMGVTFFHWTDRSAGTIQKIFEEGQWQFIAVTGDTAKRVDNNGMSESQSYEFTPNPDAHPSFFRRKKADGPDAPFQCVVKNKQTGRWVKYKQSIAIGYRDKYHDFSF